MAGATPWVRRTYLLKERHGVFVYILSSSLFYLCSYEALESDEEKGSDNESDVSKLLIVCLVIV